MEKTIIIAEAGVNHNGDIEIAKRLINEAAIAKVDYVKFQVGLPELVASKFASKAAYQEKATGGGSQLEMIKKISLSFEQHKELKLYCDTLNVKYLCTPFDIPSIDFLQSMDIPFWKIPSGEITNFPYLKHIAQTKKPIILSTGMSTLEDIQKAIDVLVKYGVIMNQITILHCNTEYPTPMEDVNLRAMAYLSKKLGVQVGYSDHTLGIEVPIAAVALGARVIEKHFTLDRNMEGPDHKASLEPEELRAMVSAIRNINMALGLAEKKITESEQKNIAIARKSIVALNYIKKGENFTEANIATKRPGSGISPMKWEEVLGKIAVRDFMEDELIEL